VIVRLLPQWEKPVHSRELLKAIYRAVAWEELFRLAPEASREQVDELFRRWRESLPAEPEHGPLPSPAEQSDPASAPREARLHCDGASSGNPGPAGIGMVLCAKDGTEIAAWGESIGRATNNVAEYAALIAGLTRALQLGVREIDVRADSQLLVYQLTGRYRVKNATLADMHAEATALLGRFDKWQARHVPREQNRKADSLATAEVKKAKAKARGH